MKNRLKFNRRQVKMVFLYFGGCKPLNKGIIFALLPNLVAAKYPGHKLVLTLNINVKLKVQTHLFCTHEPTHTMHWTAATLINTNDQSHSSNYALLLLTATELNDFFSPQH